MTTRSKTSDTARFEGAAKGIGLHLKTDVTVDGTPYTPTALAAVFTSALALMQSVDKLRTQWLDEIKAMDAAVAEADRVYQAFKPMMIGQFGSDHTTLGDFGMAPRKPRTPLTAAAKATAALKAKATREARGTTSKKQKQKIKGSIEVAITAVPTVTTPVTPTPK